MYLTIANPLFVSREMYACKNSEPQGLEEQLRLESLELAVLLMLFCFRGMCTRYVFAYYVYGVLLRAHAVLFQRYVFA